MLKEDSLNIIDFAQRPTSLWPLQMAARADTDSQSAYGSCELLDVEGDSFVGCSM